MKLPKKLSSLSLAMYLILTGLGAADIGFGIITPLVALAAGIFMLVGK